MSDRQLQLVEAAYTTPASPTSRKLLRGPDPWKTLTPAENRVVALVTEGLTSRQIAEALFVSPRTVETHLKHIYAKTFINSRVKLATEAVRRAG